MRQPTMTRLAVLAVVLAPAYALSQPASPPAQNQAAQNPAAALADRGPSAATAELLQQVAARTGMEFVVDPRVAPRMPIGSASTENLSFKELQAILRANDCFTANIGGEIFIMPAAQARQAPTRLLNRDDPSVSDHDIVTRVIHVRGGEEQTFTDPQGNVHPVGAAAVFVPVLRPMMPQEAHLAASGDYLIIVDRYDNVRRITAVIDALMK